MVTSVENSHFAAWELGTMPGKSVVLQLATLSSGMVSDASLVVWILL